MGQLQRWSGEKVEVAAGCVLSIGVFEAMHLGHQALLRVVVERARELGLVAAAITFHPAPECVLTGQETQYVLLPEERAEIMWALGIELVVLFEFGRTAASMPYVEFLERLAFAMHPVEIWAGPDFAIGKDREGTRETAGPAARRFGMRLEVLQPTVVDGRIVSSSLVKALLRSGHVRQAAKLLGRLFSVRGNVVAGAGRGRKLGFPTANVAVPAAKLLPADGVYCVQVRHRGQLYLGVANVGVAPTFGGKERRLEVHLLDWDGDLYGAPLEVSFVDWLRAERHFETAQELARQLELDVAAARTMCAAQVAEVNLAGL